MQSTEYHTSSARPIRVLVVDDSATVRVLLTRMLNENPDIDVIGTAVDGYDARDKIKELNPDVITLDIEMPRMNGLQFLRNLMRLRPMPVVMISSLTAKGAEATVLALNMGAIDYVCKPKKDPTIALGACIDQIVAKIKIASEAHIQRLETVPVAASAENGPCTLKERRLAAVRSTELVAIGASTGGTVAIRKVLEGMRADDAAILVVQHITSSFSRQFINSLNDTAPGEVVAAEHGQAIHRGCVYVAPADLHLSVERDENGFRCVLSDIEPVNFHKPAVDVLFRSIATQAGAKGIGVILTGMGSDGASALVEMKQAGCHTIAQDQHSSVIWGMPGAAIRLDAASQVLPLDQVATAVRSQLARISSSNH